MQRYDTDYVRRILFDNGYGVSIVCRSRLVGGYPVDTYGGRKGLFEVAVLKGDEKHSEICYGSPVTSDVLGHLDFHEVAEVIEQVRGLTEDYPCDRPEIDDDD